MYHLLIGAIYFHIDLYRVRWYQGQASGWNRQSHTAWVCTA